MLRRTFSVRAAAALATAMTTSSAFADFNYFWSTTPANSNIEDISNYTSATNTVNGNNYYLNNVTLTFPGPSGITPFNPGKLRIGYGGGPNAGPATLNMTGGSITPGGNNGTALTNDGAGLVIGYNANGTLNMSGNANITTARVIIVGHDGTGDSVTGTGTGVVNMTDNAVLRTSNNDFYVGAGNVGDVNVEGNASIIVTPPSLDSVENPNFVVGQSTQSTFDFNSTGSITVANSMNVGAGSAFTMSSGTVTTRFKNPGNGYGTGMNQTAPNGHVIVGTSGTGSSFTQTGGTVNVGNNLQIGQNGSTNATYTISGVNSIINTKTGGSTGTGNALVGTGTSVGATLNINGGTINVHNRFLLGQGTSTGSVVNQTAGTMTTDLAFVVSDTTTGDATYNLSGGTLTANSELSRIGRQGTGSMFQTGGVANFNAGLAIGDDGGGTGTPAGTYQISAGEVHYALTPSQTGAALRIGTVGGGTFRVVGDDGVIDVNGDFLATSGAKGVGTLAFRLETGDRFSMIDVSGNAAFSDGSAVGIDFNSVTPSGSAYNLMTASDVTIGSIGYTAPSGWSLQVVPGGNGEVLQLASDTPLPALYWDANGTGPGAGGATPSGSWNGAAANFSADPSGNSAVTATTTPDNNVVFAAGADGTGSYTVTVTGTQSADGIQIARGNVALGGDTLAVGNFNVAAGASGTISSVVNGGNTSLVTKTGTGTLTLAGANTHTLGTNVNAGTLVVGHVSALGTGAVTVTDSTLQIKSGLPTAVSANSLSLVGTGTVDMTDGALIIKTGGNLATIAAAVASGATLDLTWNGTGILSTVAANDPNGITAIGFATGADYAGGGLTDFAGAAYDDDDILIRTTYYGDSDLNGDTNLDDYPLFIFGLEDPSAPQTWYYGDYNYSGEVDIDDFPLFIAGLENDPIQTAALADLIEMSSISADNKSAMLGMLAAVPEPATFALFSAAAGGGLLRRRRR